MIDLEDEMNGGSNWLEEGEITEAPITKKPMDEIVILAAARTLAQRSAIPHKVAKTPPPLKNPRR